MSWFHGDIFVNTKRTSRMAFSFYNGRKRRWQLSCWMVSVQDFWHDACFFDCDGFITVSRLTSGRAIQTIEVVPILGWAYSSKGITLSSEMTRSNREWSVLHFPLNLNVISQVWGPEIKKTVPITFDRTLRLIFGLWFAINWPKLPSKQRPVDIWG